MKRKEDRVGARSSLHLGGRAAWRHLLHEGPEELGDVRWEGVGVGVVPAGFGRSGALVGDAEVRPGRGDPLLQVAEHCLEKLKGGGDGRKSGETEREKRPKKRGEREWTSLGALFKMHNM